MPTALLARPVPAQQPPVDRLGIPGPLSFGDAQFALRWTSDPQPGYVKQEYLPPTKWPATYESLLLIEVLDGNTDIRPAVTAQISDLNTRIGRDPLFKQQTINKPDGSEAIVFFTMAGPDAQGRNVAEWNAYRYLPVPGRGIMLFGVSRRGYGDGIEAFITRLKESRRQADLDLLASYDVPKPRRA